MIDSVNVYRDCFQFLFHLFKLKFSPQFDLLASRLSTVPDTQDRRHKNRLFVLCSATRIFFSRFRSAVLSPFPIKPDLPLQITDALIFYRLGLLTVFDSKHFFNLLVVRPGDPFSAVSFCTFASALYPLIRFGVYVARRPYKTIRVSFYFRIEDRAPSLDHEITAPAVASDLSERGTIPSQTPPPRHTYDWYYRVLLPFVTVICILIFTSRN